MKKLHLFKGGAFSMHFDEGIVIGKPKSVQRVKGSLLPLKTGHLRFQADVPFPLPRSSLYKAP